MKLFPFSDFKSDMEEMAKLMHTYIKCLPCKNLTMHKNKYWCKQEKSKYYGENPPEQCEYYEPKRK